MTQESILSSLEKLREIGDPERAVAHRRYHKSTREHWGVTVPDCEKFAKTLITDLSYHEKLTAAKILWNTNQFDAMMAAGKILCQKNVLPTPDLWNLLLDFLQQVDGWALEDLLAHVAWKCILANENLLDEVEQWTLHENFWMRRAALVYTLPYAKPGRDPERMLRWAGTYASDPEWFIQKAIGWWLRVLGEHDPERVLRFLETYGKNLKGVARKEATRKLIHNNLGVAQICRRDCTHPI